MGRKKRKLDVAADGSTQEDQEEEEEEEEDSSSAQPPVAHQQDTSKDASSSYAVTSHSGEIVQEDVYVSDGSDDSDDEQEIILLGSRLGIMRRGLHQLGALQQPNRQWTRQEKVEAGDVETTQETLTEEEKRKREEQELAQLDPAQRAARLLQEKQRREEEAKAEARRQENEDNVSRDPALFSKRTAFDIRFDQIEEKPWQRGLVPGQTAENFHEYFNYGLAEEDWLEYAQQQLMIRQELIDASKQKRMPDPNIVPIQPRKDSTPSTTSTTAPKPEENDDDKKDVESGPEVAMKQEEVEDEVMAPQKKEITEVPVGFGGAWGAGAAPGSTLARLMEEQEKNPDAILMESVRSENTATNDHYGQSEEYVAPDPGYNEGYDDGHGGYYGGRRWQQPEAYGGHPEAYGGHPEAYGGPYGGRGGRGDWRGRGGGGRGPYNREADYSYYPNEYSGSKRPRDVDPRRRR